MAHKTSAVGSLLLISCFIVCLSNSKAQLVPALYVFGDSLVDVGNNNYLKHSLSKANFPHNGLDFPTKKPTGRFSNGKNAADFLAEKLGLPVSPPYLSLSSKSIKSVAFLAGVSFASGGAGIFNGTDLLFRQSIPLSKQVDNYSKMSGEVMKKQGSAIVQKHLTKSIFFIVIGSNDIFGYNSSKFNARKKGTPQQYIDQMVLTLKAQLKRIYEFGGRKFVVTGLGPVGCIPSERKHNKTGECNDEVNYMAHKYNEGLTSMLQHMKSELNDINYTYVDTYSVFFHFIQRPASYGFTEVKAACCGLGNLNADFPCLPIAHYCSNRRNHVFWDLYHPTEASARLFVDNIYDGPQQYAFPINLKQLVLEF